jgi:hypothetical protein
MAGIIQIDNIDGRSDAADDGACTLTTPTGSSTPMKSIPRLK